MLVLHDERTALNDDSQWNLRSDPRRSQTALGAVPFQARVVGTTIVTVDVYHGLRWLMTLRVPIEMTLHANDELPPPVTQAV